MYCQKCGSMYDDGQPCCPYCKTPRAGVNNSQFHGLMPPVDPQSGMPCYERFCNRRLQHQERFDRGIRFTLDRGRDAIVHVPFVAAFRPVVPHRRQPLLQAA